MNGGLEDRKPLKMVRSSIACYKCRKSKVKCVNTGVHSTCRACAGANRECSYPPTGTTTTPKREGPSIKLEEGETKKRVRKEDPGRRGSAKNTHEDPLESPVLTRKVWEEIYEKFKLHFSTEMPFLHPPTFKSRMKQVWYPREPGGSASELQDARLLLLSVLTLTARFHPDLVAHHAVPGKPADPLHASEFYATALKAAFGPSGTNLTTQSLDGVQALLMLGLYEWGQQRGLSAWMWVGIAIRLGQSMGLAYEDAPDSSLYVPVPRAANGRKSSIKPVQPKGDIVEKEVRRRTLWSCFVMDRMLASGKYRHNMIDVKRLQINLPSSDDNFLFGTLNAQPSQLLSKDWQEQGDSSVLSRYIRLVEIFGRFSVWSNDGGRRNEVHPPWDERCGFFQLRRELSDFLAALPPNLTFTEANLSAHIEKRSATAYAAMHSLYLVCEIILHREYIPFIPVRCKRPCGPLDAPTFPSDKYTVPEGFWEDSADSICRASKNIVELVRTCQDNNVLPESPLFGFAVFQAAFVGVYIKHFDQMDTANILKHYGGSRGFDVMALGILKGLVGRLKMCKGSIQTLDKMHRYYVNFERSYEKRFGGDVMVGGGLNEYKLLERELKEFGALEDGSEGEERAASRASTNDESDPPGEPRSGAWAAVNVEFPTPAPVIANGNAPNNNGTNGNAPNGGFNPHYTSPPMMSVGSGSASELNSPYTQQGGQYMGPQQVPYHHPAQQSQQQQVYSGEQNEQWLSSIEGSFMTGAQLDGFVQDENGLGWWPNGQGVMAGGGQHPAVFGFGGGVCFPGQVLGEGFVAEGRAEDYR